MFEFSHIEDCVFNESIAGASGGSIQVDGVIHSTVKNCVFTNSIADIGGALAINRVSNNTIEDCHFLFNKARGNGGSLMITLTKTSTVHNCTFNSTEANTGGAIYLPLNIVNMDEHIHISNCIFDDNTATSFGQVIYSKQTLTKIHNFLEEHHHFLA